MNDYVFVISLIVFLVLYLVFISEKLIKWKDRDDVEKSYSVRLVIMLVVGIVLFTLKIINSK